MSENFPIPFGRYQLVERLAVGGMAELYKAEVSGAHGFSKIVVIKRILPYLAADEHYNAMFIDEAKLTARLSHPKIAQTLELGKFNGQLYIAMEYVDGLDVLAMLRECAHRRTKLPLAISIHLVQEMLDALDFAHAQTDAEGALLHVVHRDISPSNILVSRRGDVKLVDFGIAQARERAETTKSGTLKGKYGYMAPEQVVGGDVDARSDLFSAGVVLAEMAMGRRLFVAQNDLDVLLMVRDARLDRLERYGADLDAGLDKILRKALGKKPEDRFQTGGEFRDALGEWLYEHRERVTAGDVAKLVEDLYADAWQRKRATPVQPARPAMPVQREAALEPELVAERAAAPARAAAADAPEIESLDLVLAPMREFPTSASMDEAIALVAGEQDGIPVGLAGDGDESAAVVLVEQPSSSRIAAVSAPIDEGEESADIPIFEADSGRVSSAASSDYDIGSLELELEGDVHTAPPVRAGSEGDVLGDLEGPTTQELAFDDIVSAVESSLPKDTTGRAIQPTAAEIAQARQRQVELGGVDRSPDDTGELAEVPAMRVIYRLAIARATGLLVVSIGGTRKEIYMEDGRPTYVTSNVRSELFGEYLVAQRAISEGELSMALAMMPHYGGKLGDTLVGLGLMKPLDVFRHLTRQVRDKLIDVCTWGKGGFEWYEGERNAREAFPLDLDSYEVLGAGALAIARDRVDDWIAGVRDRTYKSVKAEISPEAFQLGSFVRDVYEALDGRHTVDELAARYTDDVDRGRFNRTLHLLVLTELAREQG